VCKLINKALHTEDIELLHAFPFFISDLSSSLAIEYSQKMIGQQQRTDELVLQRSRGCQLSNEEFETVRRNIGNLISINGFLSTSHSMGKFDQAHKYVEAILFSDLEQQQQQQQNITQVYNSLGTIYHSKDELEEVHQNYQRAYDLMMHSDP
jgi:tetratricopeptide (TPR) repeat protein